MLVDGRVAVGQQRGEQDGGVECGPPEVVDEGARAAAGAGNVDVQRAVVGAGIDEVDIRPVPLRDGGLGARLPLVLVLPMLPAGSLPTISTSLPCRLLLDRRDASPRHR
ncbi:hypothetical protein DL766_003458 [Monosporascus sp. MC13-8B]|uniref:Uncharacterized protein n=1 Tax=Monosporascus cannonballus TaxID=155416 RepID=A0ABY0HE08_9PEZI|nr:hypothetical protein DL762_003795 [Monosporascus cannonballus]RYP33427.1 hypothetical protein DL766_003458 [Monosporascus sp. MC13-8B]